MHSYVSGDGGTMLCLRNDLPVDRITKVRVLDPHVYKGTV